MYKKSEQKAIQVTAAIIRNNEKVLIARRKRGDNNEFKWEFPGGKIEDNESPQECLKRELFEEFGIQTTVKEFVCSSKYDYGHIFIELQAYNVDYLSGDFNLVDHDLIKWVDMSELIEENLAEADIKIAKYLLDNKKSINH